jgi:ABC-type nitrate/sulfonate/bicarbonate transport system substrate-binding protein
MNRRRLLAAGAGGIALSLAARAVSRAAPAVAVRTQLLWIPNVAYAGFWIADARGLFARQGVAATFRPGGPGLPSVAEVLAAGHADVGVEELERIVRARVAPDPRGDFVVFGSLYQQPVGGLLSLPKAPIRSAFDIVGKRIGIPPGAREHVDAILRLNRLPPNYIEVSTGYDPRPLLRGECDGFLCYLTGQPVELAERKIPYVLAPFAALGYASYSSALFCTRAYLSRERETLVRYLRAALQGWAVNRADPELGALLATNRYGESLGLDVRRQLAQNEAQLPLVGTDRDLLSISRARVAGPVYDTLRALNVGSLPPVDRLIDDSLYRDAKQ